MIICSPVAGSFVLTALGTTKSSVQVRSEMPAICAGNKKKAALMVSQLQYLNICNSWIYHYTQVAIVAPLWSKRNRSPRIPNPLNAQGIFNHRRASYRPHSCVRGRLRYSTRKLQAAENRLRGIRSGPIRRRGNPQQSTHKGYQEIDANHQSDIQEGC